MTTVSATFAGALVAGLLGSGHCAGMCGPFAAWAASRRRVAAHTAAYQLGRLLSYLSVGVVAGILGKALGDAAALVSAQGVAAVIAALVLLVAGLSQLLPPRPAGPIRIARSARHFPTCVLGGTWPRLASAGKARMLRTPWGTLGKRRFSQRRGRTAAPPRRSTGPVAREGLPARLSGKLVSLSAAAGPHTGPLLLGAAAAMLPCGMLWAFALAAAATASVPASVAVMAGLWLGSVPALIATAAAAGLLRGRLRTHGRKLVGIALILLAGFSLAHRWPSATTTPAQTAGSCPHHAK